MQDASLPRMATTIDVVEALGVTPATARRIIRRLPGGQRIFGKMYVPRRVLAALLSGELNLDDLMRAGADDLPPAHAITKAW